MADGGLVLGSSHDRARWLQLRMSGIGASEIAAVLGESPWLSAAELYAQKIGACEPMADDPEWVYWGRQLESAIVAGYQDRTGRPVRMAGLLLRSTDVPWAICTLDAYTGEPGREPAWPFEVKNVAGHRADEWIDGAPRHYYLQIQHQLLVTGARKATIAALIGGQRLIWQDIARDEIEIRRIKLAGEIFWTQCVQKGICPKPDGSDSASRALNALYRSKPAPEAHVKLSAAMAELDDELCVIKAEQKPLRKRRAEIENLIKAALGTAAFGVLPSGASYSWTKQSNGACVLRRHRSREEKQRGRT